MKKVFLVASIICLCMLQTACSPKVRFQDGVAEFSRTLDLNTGQSVDSVRVKVYMDLADRVSIIPSSWVKPTPPHWLHDGEIRLDGTNLDPPVNSDWWTGDSLDPGFSTDSATEIAVQPPDRVATTYSIYHPAGVLSYQPVPDQLRRGQGFFLRTESRISSMHLQVWSDSDELLFEQIRESTGSWNPEIYFGLEINYSGSSIRVEIHLIDSYGTGDYSGDNSMQATYEIYLTKRIAVNG